MRIAAAAGYSPRGAILLLTKFEELDREYVVHSDTPTEELSQIAIEGLEGYFRSHPEPSERLAQVNEVIADDQLNLNRPLTPIQLRGDAAHGD